MKTEKLVQMEDQYGANNYHPLDISAGDWLLPLAERYDVGVLNDAAMAHGLLTGQDPKAIAAQGALQGALKEMVPDAQKLYDWCHGKDIPMAAIVFQFCLRQPRIHCTLTGIKTRAELETNLRGATVALPDDVWRELDALGITHSRYGGQPAEARESSR